MNNSQVAHKWANQIGTHGRGSNFYFEREVLYSYGTHFPVGRVVKFPNRTPYSVTGPNTAFLIASRSYSVTTAKHKAEAWAAVPNDHGVVFCVPNVADDSAGAIAGNYQYYVDEIKKRCATAVRARAYIDSRVAEVSTIIDEAWRYAYAFPGGGRAGAKWKKQINEYKRRLEADELFTTGEKMKMAERAKRWEQEKAQRAEQRRAYIAELEKQEQERAAKYAGELEQWANGAPGVALNSAFRHLPTRLRIKGASVETSRGAVVSCKAALALYHAIKSGRDVEGMVIDGYTVTGWVLAEFTDEKSCLADILVIGCHNIMRAEIDRIGALLEARAETLKADAQEAVKEAEQTGGDAIGGAKE